MSDPLPTTAPHKSTLRGIGPKVCSRTFLVPLWSQGPEATGSPTSICLTHCHHFSTSLIKFRAFRRKNQSKAQEQIIQPLPLTFPLCLKYIRWFNATLSIATKEMNLRTGTNVLKITLSMCVLAASLLCSSPLFLNSVYQETFHYFIPPQIQFPNYFLPD